MGGGGNYNNYENDAHFKHNFIITYFFSVPDW